MRRLAIVVAMFALAAVVLAETAAAGCFATAGVTPPPGGIEPGDKWIARIDVLQHGVRPLPGAKPQVTIVNVETGARTTFAARPTAKTGRYAATVVFPAAGSWRYEVYDGFVPSECAQTHSFDAVTIGAPPAASPPEPPKVAEPAPIAIGASEESSFPTGALVGAVGIAALAALGAAVALGRRRRSVA